MKQKKEGKKKEKRKKEKKEEVESGEREKRRRFLFFYFFKVFPRKSVFMSHEKIITCLSTHYKNKKKQKKIPLNISSSCLSLLFSLFFYHMKDEIGLNRVNCEGSPHNPPVLIALAFLPFRFSETMK